MNLFELAQAASNISLLGEVVSKAARVLVDPTAPSEDW